VLIFLIYVRKFYSITAYEKCNKKKKRISTCILRNCSIKKKKIGNKYIR